jgi:predicted metal-dependent hydrolase
MPLDFFLHKHEAVRILTQRVEYFNQQYRLPYTKIVVRNQKTRWGSCSRKGTLSFNYRLSQMSDELRDYVVVHELCHVGQFNHSHKFWELVAQTIPDYKNIRKKLKAIRM